VAAEAEQTYCPTRRKNPEEYSLNDHIAYRYAGSSDISRDLERRANDARNVS
jgi:hypothetical protein